MPDFGTVDWSGLWAVVSSFVTALQVPIAIIVGLTVAEMAVKAIVSVLRDSDEVEEDVLTTHEDYEQFITATNPGRNTRADGWLEDALSDYDPDQYDAQRVAAMRLERDDYTT